MNLSGFVNAGLQLGLQSVVISPVIRGLYGIRIDDGTVLPDILAHATIEEHHKDELEITEHPIEQGAAISDHAFKRPATVTLELGWSNSPVDTGGLVNEALGFGAAMNPTIQKVANIGSLIQGATGLLSALNGSNMDQIQAIYQQLLELQERRAMFVLYTGKRVYTNMVCQSLSTETDYKTANSLPIRMTCRQVILVNTQTVSLPGDSQTYRTVTASPVDEGVQYPNRIG